MHKYHRADTGKAVALRKESVDRNNDTPQKKKINPVALRKESVDRNISMDSYLESIKPSLSARRAWIEICSFWC